jgi:signal transduction histidine kinase
LRKNKFSNDDKKSIRENLLKIISHDVYSPLRFSTMIGKTVVLLQHEMDKKEVIDNLEDINITSAKILLLLSNILKIVEFDNGEYTPFICNESLHTLVQDKIDFFKLIAKTKEIEIINSIPPSVVIKTDKTIFGIIIQNLLSNALKFTRKNGKIIIRYKKSKSFVTITIKDTGKGMSQKIVSAIEQNNAVIIKPDTDNIKGNGLGWLLIRDLILLLKGKFKISSTPNAGTTINILLPILE